jgi:pyridoxamine 5'-phosphate oxidase
MEIFSSSNISQEPIVKINNWLKEAVKQHVPLPHAMCLSTSDLSGKPSSRMVLLKSLSDEGLIFYTDYESKKGDLLNLNPFAALNFWWPATDKQIRIQGICKKTSKKQSDEYFYSRPRASQISATVSLQSKEISSYKELLKKAEKLEVSLKEESITRPKRWGGFLLIPKEIEFWTNEDNRLHKRELYSLPEEELREKEQAIWIKTFLSP